MENKPATQVRNNLQDDFGYLHLMFYVIFLFFIISCKGKNAISDERKSLIEFGIRMHNNANRLAFSLDSIDETVKFKIRYLNLPDSAKERGLEIHMAVFKNDWNRPYKIEKDYELTYDSYLQYCRTMNLDSLTYIDLLNK